MTDNRFADKLSPPAEPFTPAGFLVVPVAMVEQPTASPLQWLYQKLYEQAAQANQPPRTRDLFAVMN